MRIIDMRLRPPLSSWLKNAQWKEGTNYYPTRYGFPRPKSVVTQNLDDTLEEMDTAGITWGVIMGRQSAPPHGAVPNDEITEILTKYPNRFVSLAGIDLRDIDAGVREIQRTAKIQGYCGASIEPGSSYEAMYSDDPRLYPLYDTCQALQIPMSIGLSGYLSAMVGHDLSYGSPTSVYKVAKAFPKLKIIVSHAAWPNVMPMLEVAFLCDNVYVSPDLYQNSINTPGAHEYLKAAQLFLEDRLLFGTAYPSRPLKQSVQGFMEWDISAWLRNKVLYANAARVLGLD